MLPQSYIHFLQKNNFYFQTEYTTKNQEHVWIYRMDCLRSAYRTPESLITEVNFLEQLAESLFEHYSEFYFVFRPDYCNKFWNHHIDMIITQHNGNKL